MAKEKKQSTEAERAPLTDEQRAAREKRKKSQRIKKIVINVLLVFFFAVICFSAYKLITADAEYKEGEKSYEHVLEEVEIEPPPVTAEELNDPDFHVPKQPFVDFEALKSINKDFSGWLYSPGTPINYPVVQGSNNSHYLRYLFDGTRHKYGTLFIHNQNNMYFQDDNTIIYGHHMHDGSMFQSLTKYRNKKYYEEHKAMLYYTEENTYRFDVVGAYITNVGDICYTLDYGTEKNYNTFIKHVKSESLFKTEIAPVYGDKLVTLSTCTYEYTDARFVVILKVSLVEEE